MSPWVGMTMDRKAARRRIEEEIRRAAAPVMVDPRVLTRHGRIKRHPFEEPHDVPGQDRCWLCLKPSSAKVHR